MVFKKIKKFIKGKKKVSKPKKSKPKPKKAIKKKPAKKFKKKPKKVLKKTPKKAVKKKPKKAVKKFKKKPKKVLKKKLKKAVKKKPKKAVKKKPQAKPKKRPVRRKKIIRQKKLHILPPTLRITTKVIEDLITNLAGDDVHPLVALIKDKKNVSEFKLAEQLNLTVNQVRNMLYRLYKHSLVTFVRKKDKKKGWYVYYWTLNMDNVKEALLKFKKAKLAEFKSRLSNEQSGTFFVCPNACMRLKFENAMEYDFKCQECGQLMKQQDNSRTITNIRVKIRELEEELDLRKPEEPKAAKKGAKK